MPFQNPRNLRNAGKGLVQPDSPVFVGFQAWVERVGGFKSNLRINIPPPHLLLSKRLCETLPKLPFA